MDQDLVGNYFQLIKWIRVCLNEKDMWSFTNARCGSFISIHHDNNDLISHIEKKGRGTASEADISLEKQHKPLTNFMKILHVLIVSVDWKFEIKFLRLNNKL